MMRQLVINVLVTAALSGLFLVALFYMVPARAAERICGEVSWYGYESGSTTASGERFNPNALTAAMPSRNHIGERWRVSAGGRSVTVRINDYGPAKRLHRIADLSKAAFGRLANTKRGHLHVCMEKQ